MLIYRTRFLTRGEVWFDDEPDGAGRVDCIYYLRCSRPVPGAKARRFPTYVIDLKQTPKQLQAKLTKDTAYQVRRARERDGVVCDTCDPRDPAVFDRFEQTFNAFAALKGLGPLERSRMASMAAAGVLDLSVAKDPQGRVLVYHANFRGRRRAGGIKLASLYRAIPDRAQQHLIGRANRYLTWHEILRYQEQGLEFFDFGGWYHGSDPGMQRVNDFKRGFGGQILGEFQCEQVLTLKGKVVIAAAHLRERVKSFLTGRHGPLEVPPSEDRKPSGQISTVGA